MGEERATAFGRFDLTDIGVLQPGPDRDFDTAVALAARALRAPVATFAVLDFAAGVSRLRAHTGTTASVVDVQEIPLQESLTLRAMSATDVIAVPDTSRHHATSGHPFVLSQGVQSLLGAPVLCPAQDVVALLAVHERVPRVWTDADRDMMLGIAHFCTQIILLRASLRTLGLVSLGARHVV